MTPERIADCFLRDAVENGVYRHFPAYSPSDSGQ